MNVSKVLLSLTLLAILSAGSFAIDIVNPGFEDDANATGNFIPTGWSAGGATGNCGVWTPGLSDTDYLCTLGTTCTMYQTTDEVIAAAGIGYVVEVDTRNSWQGSPQVTIYYDQDGTQVALGSAYLEIGDSDSWDTSQVLTLEVTTTQASVGYNLGIEFTDNGQSGWTEWDNVTLERLSVVAVVAPEKNAINAPLDQDIEWNITDESIPYFDLYFGPEDEPNLITEASYKILTMEDAATVGYDPGTLEYNTTYYWRVDVYDPNGDGYIITPGPVWQFTTIGQAPTVDPVEPAYSAVDGDGSESVTLTVATINAESWQWYKADDSGDIALADNDKYSGANSDTLTISNVDISDEGYYYCGAENSVYPDPVDNSQNGPGRVMTHRLTSYFSMDEIEADGITILDSVDGYDITLLNEDEAGTIPTLTDGVDELGGSSLRLANTDSSDVSTWGQYAQIEAGAIDYMDYTIEMWAYWNGGDNWQRLFDFGNSTTEYLFLSPNSSNGNMRFASVDGGDEQALICDMPATSQWFHVAVTCSGDIGKLYLNGEMVSTGDWVIIDPIDLMPSLCYLGKSMWSSDALLNGMIDELAIYNYARTTEEIAHSYIDVKGGWICNRDVEQLAYDLDDNCVIDINDFALLAETWMWSNRIE